MRYSKWRIRPHEAEKIGSLARGAGISPLLAQVLLNRGIDAPEQVARFMDAKLTGLNDPESLPGAALAAEKIVGALRSGKKIVIYGDYDVDGVCGTSILWACLNLAGAQPGQVTYYLPNRLEEGYGLNSESLRTLAQRGVDLVVSVDCGITAVAEAELRGSWGSS